MCWLAVWKLLHWTVSLRCALALTSSECGVLWAGEFVLAVRTVVLSLPSKIQHSRNNKKCFLYLKKMAAQCWETFGTALQITRFSYPRVPEPWIPNPLSSRRTTFDSLRNYCKKWRHYRSKVELHLSGSWLSGQPFIRIGLALLVNLSRILQN